jgi:hypothetical protein
MNGFLKDFMQMRKSLNQSQTPQPAASSPPVKGKKEKKITKEQKVIGGGYQHIVENKPPRKDVIFYLQDRANELTVEKMK